MKYSLYFSTLLLCAVTLASTVLFWSSMPTDTLGKVIAGVTATALEACKYSFFPAGIYYLRKRNVGGAGLLLIGILLLVVSVSATTAFLETSYHQQQTDAQQNSVEHQTKKQQLNSLQQQIDTLNNLIAADAQADRRTRALEYTKQVKELEEKRDTTLAGFQNIKESPQGGAQSLFSVLAMPLHSSPDAVRQGAFIGLALIVDVSAIACLLSLTGLPAKAAPTEPQKAPQNPKSMPVLIAGRPQQLTEPPPTQLNDSDHALAARIVAGEFGEQPKVRDVMVLAKARHPEVKKVFDLLLDSNQLKREGKKFFLTQAVIV